MKASRTAFASGWLVGALLAVSLFFLLNGSCRAGDAGDKTHFPLLKTPVLTSGFCEYRSGHFHYGIDLSTDSRTGVPVVAVRPGYVYRVRASGIGYGRAVYVLLDNGLFAVYGHLEAAWGQSDTDIRGSEDRRPNRRPEHIFRDRDLRQQHDDHMGLRLY